jgi:NAD(P)H-hydrate epimerase
MALSTERGMALLSVAEMYRADALTTMGAIEGGVTGIVLMEHAAAAIVREIRRRWTPRPTLVLCGPGNNGGDGYGVACLLARARWPVTVASLGDPARLKGDAAIMAARWPGSVADLDSGLLDGAALVVDAVFGAGLTRPVDGVAQDIITALAARAVPVLAVDVPSGVHGDTGVVMGAAAPAAVTVTFFRPKPGHFLLPGRALRGDLVVADIATPTAVLDEIAPKASVNGPDLWARHLPRPGPENHKYHRGHALVVGGPEASTGAARLAAGAALRVGAGLVTVAAPPGSIGAYGAHLTSVMTRAVADDAAFDAILADKRKNAVLLGPGAGVDETTRRRVLATLGAGKACVLDADALTVFADKPAELFAALRARCVLTPHDGEYARLLDATGDRLTRARALAEASGAVVLLKGGDTVVAAPVGRAAICANAPPSLATAGSGDVLSGLILGLLAQGAPPFEAACAAAWMHGEAARALGPGLVSSDLSGALSGVLRRLQTGA